jgi:hypothetical protein
VYTDGKAQSSKLAKEGHQFVHVVPSCAAAREAVTALSLSLMDAMSIRRFAIPTQGKLLRVWVRGRQFCDWEE